MEILYRYDNVIVDLNVSIRNDSIKFDVRSIQIICVRNVKKKTMSKDFNIKCYYHNYLIIIINSIQRLIR